MRLASTCWASAATTHCLRLRPEGVTRPPKKPLTAAEADAAYAALQQLAQSWEEVTPSDLIRTTAQRLLRTHPLRAADSLQLAAARVASGREPSELEFVCLDERLGNAARREGFPVVALSAY